MGFYLLLIYLIILLISEDFFPYDIRQWLDDNLRYVFVVSILIIGSIFAFFQILNIKQINTKNMKIQKEMFVGYEQEDVIRCPRCKSTQLSANKRGFSLGKAAAGGIITGGIGLLGGFIGSGKVKITCLKCGNSWTTGKR